MTNITSERVIGLSTNPLRFYNDVDLESVQIPEEPMEFREFMDQGKLLELEGALIESGETYSNSMFYF